MKRFFVCRHWIKWKGKIYKKGELLPETFTHHDKARHIFNSRIGMCEVAEESAPETLSMPTEQLPPVSKAPPAPVSGQSPQKPSMTSTQKGAAPADGKPAFQFKPTTTGTPK